MEKDGITNGEMNSVDVEKKNIWILQSTWKKNICDGRMIDKNCFIVVNA